MYENKDKTLLHFLSQSLVQDKLNCRSIGGLEQKVGVAVCTLLLAHVV